MYKRQGHDLQGDEEGCEYAACQQLAPVGEHDARYCGREMCIRDRGNVFEDATGKGHTLTTSATPTWIDGILSTDKSTEWK